MIKKEKSAGAVIFREEEDRNYYLILHYESGHWDFPKGHIEKGEEEKETTKREIKEETGIGEIEFVPEFKKRITYFFRKKEEEDKNNPLVFKEVIFYLAKTKKKDIKISFEHIGYDWLEYKEADERLTYKNAKDILSSADDFLKNNANKGQEKLQI